MELNTTILREIAFQINQGNPWWGMLLLNEYLLIDNELRQKIVAQFLQRIAPQKTTPLAERLLEGCGLSELPQELHATVGIRAIRPSQPIPGPRKRRSSPRRLAARERTSAGIPRPQSTLQKKLLANKRPTTLYAVQP